MALSRTIVTVRKCTSAFAGHANLGVELCEIPISLPRIMKAVSEAVQFERARILSCQTAAPTRACRHHYRARPQVIAAWFHAAA